jgi:hypothetical protein
VPLTLLVEWRGFRMRVTSDLPINSSTQVYGASDNANGIPSRLINTNDAFGNEMTLLADRLHLRSHRARIGSGEDATLQTAAPADLQGHITSGGQMYAVRLARIFPPGRHKASCRLHCHFTTPLCFMLVFDWLMSLIEHSLMTRHLSVPEQSIFFRLFRAELIDSFNASTSRVLNPDSLSAFTISDDSDASLHNDDIAAATRYLLADVVPKLADDLHHILWKAKQTASATAIGSSISSVDVFTAQANALREESHQRGVNMRHMGAVYAMMPATCDARSILLMDMVARTCKNIARDRLRRAYAPSLAAAAAAPPPVSSSPVVSPYRAMVGPPRSTRRAPVASSTSMSPSATIIDFINRLSNGDASTWTHVKEQLHARFGIIGVQPRDSTSITDYTHSDLFAAVRSSLLYIIPYTLQECGQRMIPSVAAAFGQQSPAALSDYWHWKRHVHHVHVYLL